MLFGLYILLCPFEKLEDDIIAHISITSLLLEIRLRLFLRYGATLFVRTEKDLLIEKGSHSESSILHKL